MVEKNAESNTVTLSPDEQLLFKTRVLIKGLSLISGDIPTEPFSCTAKLRYSAPDTECVVYPGGKNAVIEFVKPVRAPSPGQSAVFYQGEKVLGGAIIVKGE